MILIKLILKFIKIINSEAEPWQIGAGFAVGLFFGLTPLLSLHNALLVVLLLFIRINVTSALVAWGIFTGVSFLTDGLAHRIGSSLLANESLGGLWHFFSETPVLALFNLNHTITLGSLILAAAAALPVFLLVTVCVHLFRTKLKERVEKWKIIKYLKMTKIAKLYGTAKRLK
jgi:uncharacterized protein (TIGR03546 family)